ncbi:MAG: hypothetical protein AB7V40_06455 [Methyloceanibacter sp.]
MAGLGDGAPFGDASPSGDGPEPSRKEAAEYIAGMLEGLVRVANSANMPFLAYLLNVALEQAKIDKTDRD